LGTFEGRKVQVAELRIRGGSGERIGTMDYEEEFYFVGKAVVSKITHGDVKEKFTRTHVATTSALVIIDREDGEQMLTEASMMADERFGVANLFAQAGQAIGYDPDTGELLDEGGSGDADDD
jgi:hypothetical protein